MQAAHTHARARTMRRNLSALGGAWCRGGIKTSPSCTQESYGCFPLSHHNDDRTPHSVCLLRAVGLCSCCFGWQLSPHWSDHHWGHKRDLPEHFHCIERHFEVRGFIFLAKRLKLNATMRDSDVYFIYAGTYNEQVYINRPNVTVIGESRQTTRFCSNTVHITNSLPATQAGSNDLSGTVRVSAISTGVKLYNRKLWLALYRRSFQLIKSVQ